MNFLKRQYDIFTSEENKNISELVVLVAGCGGLGTNQVMQLQRIGVKKVYIVDYDKVEETNLNRQVLYSYSDIGLYKVNVAKRKLDNNKLKTEIIPIISKIEEGFAIPKDVNIILDALDNFESRLFLEEISLKNNIPFIHGGINSMRGQVISITNESKTKLKDLIGEVNKTKINSFLPVISLIASLQVNEAVKFISNKDNILIDKLLLIDLDDYSFNIINLKNKKI